MASAVIDVGTQAYEAARWPSRYHSVRAISAPPRRPAQLIRMPSGAQAHRRLHGPLHGAAKGHPSLQAAGRYSRPPARASVSGLRISTMFRVHIAAGHILRARACSFSMSAPFLPITTPGRAVWIVTRAFFAGRSITTLRGTGLFQALVAGTF